MVEKGIRGGICHAIYWYAKLITNTWKIMINKELSYIVYWDLIIYMYGNVTKVACNWF